MRRVTRLIGGIVILVWGFCASCGPKSDYADSGGVAVPGPPEPSDELTGGSTFLGVDPTNFGRGGASALPTSCTGSVFFPFAGGAGGAGGDSGRPLNGFGCPKTAPEPGSTCDWARVQCAYDLIDCDRTPDAMAFVCCDGKWNASFICQ